MLNGHVWLVDLLWGTSVSPINRIEWDGIKLCAERAMSNTRQTLIDFISLIVLRLSIMVWYYVTENRIRTCALHKTEDIQFSLKCLQWLFCLLADCQVKSNRIANAGSTE